jgi:VanZ family protein
VALARVWTLVGWLGIFAVTYLSLMPDPPHPSFEQGDKFEHVAAYCFLAWWFAQIAVARSARVRLALGLLALGIGLEIAQLAVPQRTFSIADMLANAIGIGLALRMAPPRTPNVLRLLARWTQAPSKQAVEAVPAIARPPARTPSSFRRTRTCSRCSTSHAAIFGDPRLVRLRHAVDREFVQTGADEASATLELFESSRR